ncbi:Ig-like domain-containing protein [Cesiribacter andamanensis]|nr:Ig-like domain-containing protein [Cesiribacter andamanensis]
MKHTKMLFSLFALSGMLFFTGCDDDDNGAPALTIQSISASGTDLETGQTVQKDLNAASAAEDVPLDAVMTVTFSSDVNASTATASNVSLTSASGTVPVTVSASGNTMTITPQQELERGTQYTLNLGNGISGANGGAFTATTRTFTSAGRGAVTPPQSASQTAYFTFDGHADDAMGTYDADDVVDITWVADRFGQMESAAQFNGNTSIIEVPNGADLLTSDWTLSFWSWVDTVDHVNADGNKAGHFIMGVGAFHGFQVETNGRADVLIMAARYSKEDGTTIPNNFFVNADGQDAANGGWDAIEVEANVAGGMRTLLAQKWAHIVLTYNSEENKRSLYINGQLMERDNLNIPTDLSTVNGLTFDPTGTADVIGDKLAFGFPFDRSTTLWQNEPWGSYNLPTANHFKGALDDVRFFEAALSEAEVTALYNAERP